MHEIAPQKICILIFRVGKCECVKFQSKNICDVRIPNELIIHSVIKQQSYAFLFSLAEQTIIINGRAEPRRQAQFLLQKEKKLCKAGRFFIHNTARYPYD